MAQNTAIAYCIMLMLSPIPNMGIVSYINKKPLLTKVCIWHYNFCSENEILQYLVQNLKKNQQYIWSFRLFLIIIIRIWYSSIGQCQPYWFVGWCFSTFQVYLNIFYNLVGLIKERFFLLNMIFINIELFQVIMKTMALQQELYWKK